MNETDVIRALAALAQPMRLRVYRALVGAGDKGMVPSTLSSCLGVPPPTLSFHLKELAQAQLVTQQRCGRYLVYRASAQDMQAVLGYLTSHCCHGVSCR